MIEHCVIYDDGSEIPSHKGWYYINSQGFLVGPFYSEYQAQSHSDEDRDYEGC